MAEIILETDRLVLRRWAERDIDAWLEHLNTPQVMTYLGGPRPVEKVAEKFEKMRRGWDEDGFSFLALALKSGGVFLGTCGIARIETEHAPSVLRGAIQIGWQLRADHWGQGYALEAARAMMTFAFDNVGIDMLYSQTSTRNIASWRLMEKLGLQRHADLDYNDPTYPSEENPTMVYGLGATTWRARASGAVDAA